jgi:hypothetical protein
MVMMQHDSMLEMCGEMDVQLHAFLMVRFTPQTLYPEGKQPIAIISDWVGPKADLDVVMIRIPVPAGNRTRNP